MLAQIMAKQNHTIHDSTLDPLSVARSANEYRLADMSRIGANGWRLG